jgi:predicted outer membrane repeat protein
MTGEEFMDTRVVDRAYARPKRLVTCLCAALALGRGIVATPAFAEASQSARQRSLMQRLESGDPLAARVAAVLANRPPPRPGGTTIPVTNCNDDGSGSLRDAVENIAISGDTVSMAGLSCSTITLTSGAIVAVQDDLTIVGPGTDMYGVTIDANYASGIFLHTGAGTLRLKYMTVLNGGKYTSGDADASGGGIYSTGVVDVLDSGVKYCVAEADGTGDARGGGVYAKLGFSSSVATISGNSARGGFSAGGGVFARDLVSTYSWFRNNEAGSSGGAILAVADASVNTSTISGNSASLVGGVHLLGYGATGPLEISHSTIADNYSADARFGGGVHLGNTGTISNSTITGNVARGSAKYGAGIQIGPGASLTLHSTIASANTLYDGTSHLPDDIGLYGSGTVAGGAGNLVGYAAAVLEMPTDTIFTSDPGLGDLTQNGGPTPTMLPISGSLAIDNGHNIYNHTFDQRGPGYPRVLGAFTDVGAVESTEDPGNDVIFADGFD